MAKSFDLAAEAYADAVGGSMSSDSLRRITEGWGRRVEKQREEAAEGKEWVEERLGHLWEGEVMKVEAALEVLDLDQERWPAEVRQAPGYFENNRKRMRYDEFRAEGYPIGSGTVESGINTVVHHRMKRPGRGWERSNGQAMLAGLSELHSGRFDQAWKATLPLAA